eukprot:gene15737-20851_t
MIAASLIGVSITRSAPKRSYAAATHVLAEHHHARVGLHLALQREEGGFGIAQLLLGQCHWPAPVVCTSVKAAPASGQGAAS